MKKLIGSIALSLAMVFAGGGASAADKLKIGFIYVGPVGDHGWSYQHDQGRQAIEKEFGDKVETVFVEKVAEGPDAERAIERLARQGAGLIFTTSFGFMNPTLKVAKSFPDVRFEHATGYKQSNNVATYAARFYQGRHIAGLIAGKMTKTNIIGYIGSFPIPEVVRGINATTLALQKVNPKATVKVVWVNTWYDPGKEGAAAKALIDQGADVIMQHTDSPAAVQAAQERGVWAVGQASDMTHFGPKSHLTAIVDVWDNYYVARAGAVLDGTWKSSDTWDGLKQGMLQMAPYNSAIPADVLAMVKKAEADIIAGTLHPFAGPINDQMGKEKVAAGKNLDDGSLLSMNWYVQGVQGKLPK